MRGQELSQMCEKMECIQFIAELSLITNSKPSDLRLALTIIADLVQPQASKDVSVDALLCRLDQNH